MSITLLENMRAVFYAPFYATCALGAFEAEGVDVEVKASHDAARTIEMLINGAAAVSWGGALRLMEGTERNPPRRPVVFCEIVGRDPFFLLAREPNPRFALKDLIGKKLATVTEVPTPWMCLQYDMHLAGLDATTLTRTRRRSMAENVAALLAGEADVVQVFQPYAEDLLASGAAHIWYAAADRGSVAYTSLNTTRDFLERDPRTVLAMCRAIYRTQRWIFAHDAEALAEVIGGYFPDLSQAVLAACCARYKALKLWNENPLQSRAGFEWLRDAGLHTGRLRTKFSYEDCVDMRFAEQAIRENPPALDRRAHPVR
jgi:NitT/TauT family transport system substrate-binding protein